MSYLVRFYQRKPHPIAHRVHQIDGVTGALCSKTPKPAVGDRTRSGEWELLEALPPEVRICHICQRIKQKLDNPLPERVEQDLEKLAFWDPRAAAIQREKMIAFYRQKQFARR
jgi:hypothetical protein